MTLYLFSHYAFAMPPGSQQGKISHPVPHLILTGGVRLAGKEQPTIGDSFAELNGEISFNPILIDKGQAGINLGYSTVNAKNFSQNKVGIGLNYKEIMSPSWIGMALWVYANELSNGNQKHYFNSIATEFEASLGLGVGFGIELTQFDYGQMKQGDGLLMTIYGKLGISVIPTDWF